MWFPKKMAILGLLLITLASQFQKSASTNSPVDSKTDVGSFPENISPDSAIANKRKEKAIKAAFVSTLGTASMLLFMAPLPPPTGAILGTVAALFLAAYHVNEASNVIENADQKLAFISKMQKINERVTTINAKVIDRVTHVLSGEKLLIDMRITLETIDENYKENIDYLLDTNLKSEKKKILVDRMIDSNHHFYKSLLSITNKYIRPSNTPLAYVEKESSFFKAVGTNDRHDAEDYRNCGLESDHRTLYITYRYISRVLIRGYFMVVAGHLAKFQEYIESNQSDNANYILEDAKKVIQNFVNRTSLFMDDVKTELEKTSRDIRPCDSMKPKLGETYLRLSNFAGIQLTFTQFIKPMPPGRVGVAPLNYSSIVNIFGNFKHKSLRKIPGECEPFDSIDLPYIYDEDHSCEVHDTSGRIDLYTDPTDKERKYSYLTRTELTSLGINLGTVPLYGNTNQKKTHHVDLGAISFCNLYACTIFDKEGRVKFSTKKVHAQNGYVVTGIRWKVVNEIIYMQIQEGKFENIISVDPDTVHWKDIETHGTDENVITLNETQRAVIIDDSILQDGFCVTGVQLVLLDGKISLMVIGSEINESGDGLKNSSELNVLRKNVPKMVELKLDNAEIPERAPRNQMNGLVGKPGEYYVQFQPSGLDADVGQTTIPYLDIQDVVAETSYPISGIGIYFKRIEKFGGFLGLKMISPRLDKSIDKGILDENAKEFLENFNKIIATDIGKKD